MLPVHPPTVLVGSLDAKMVLDEEVAPSAIGLTRFDRALYLCSLFPIVWMIWDAITRGGMSLKLAGLALVRWDGQPAPRWRCAWRSLVVWTPLFGLLVASTWVQGQIPTPDWASWVPYGLATALLPLYVGLGRLDMSLPRERPHDRLSGLRVVPR